MLKLFLILYCITIVFIFHGRQINRFVLSIVNRDKKFEVLWNDIKKRRPAVETFLKTYEKPLIVGLYFLPSIVVILAKAYLISAHGDFMAIETMAPAHLSAEGARITKHLRDNDMVALIADARDIPYTKKDKKRRDYRGYQFQLIFNALSEDSHSQSGLKTLLVDNDLPLHINVGMRGAIMHHYSTILYHYRDLEAGHVVPAFTSQYGIAAELPVFAFKGTSFVTYSVFSLGLIAVIALGFQIFFLRKADALYLSLPFAIILFAIAWGANQGALMFSPGFGIYRFLPLFAIFAVLLMRDRLNGFSIFIVTLGLAALDSLAFNTLVVLIILSFQGIQLFVRKFQFCPFEDMRLFYVALACGICTLLQYGLLVSNADSFTLSPFSSVSGEIDFRFNYAFRVCLLPLGLLVVKAVRFHEVKLDADELISYLIYGFVATYCIAFAHSPQHYVGFLCAASPAVFVMIYKACRGNQWANAAAALCLFWASLPNNFMTPPLRVNEEPSVFHAGRTFGTTFKFTTATDFEAMYAQYTGVLNAAGATDANTYFLSKDKLYFEELRGKNMLPRGYDPYVNLRQIDLNTFQTALQKEGVRFIVLDSGKHTSSFKQFLGLMYADKPEHQEFLDYMAILDHAEKLRGVGYLSEVDCSQRYCIYKVNDLGVTTPRRLEARG